MSVAHKLALYTLIAECLVIALVVLIVGWSGGPGWAQAGFGSTVAVLYRVGGK